MTGDRGPGIDGGDFARGPLEPMRESIEIQNEISGEFKRYAIPLYWIAWLVISVPIQIYMLLEFEPSIELLRTILIINTFFALIPLLWVGLLSIAAALKSWK